MSLGAFVRTRYGAGWRTRAALEAHTFTPHLLQQLEARILVGLGVSMCSFFSAVARRLYRFKRVCTSPQ